MTSPEHCSLGKGQKTLKLFSHFGSRVSLLLIYEEYYANNTYVIKIFIPNNPGPPGFTKPGNNRQMIYETSPYVSEFLSLLLHELSNEIRENTAKNRNLLL